MATNPSDLVSEGAVTVSEALRISGIGRSVLYDLMSKGEIPFAQVGRRRLVPRRALAQFLERRLVVAGAGG
jgi:excisionase family DNA binding protein